MAFVGFLGFSLVTSFKTGLSILPLTHSRNSLGE
jgi:hypothetical protein